MELKVKLEEPTMMNAMRETMWYTDPELRSLDVAAGTVHNSKWFSIVTVDGDHHIGSCTLYNYKDYQAEFGIRIGDKNYWNRGYGTDATLLLLKYGFEVMGLQLVWLKVLPENIRAIRCYEKCGFTRTGKLALDGYEFATMEKRR